jgi:hypothetical protein
LLIDVGEAMVTEQFMEFFEMDTSASATSHPLLEGVEEKSSTEQKEKLFSAIEAFMLQHGYVMVDIPSDTVNPQTDDTVFNYSSYLKCTTLQQRAICIEQC